MTFRVGQKVVCVDASSSGILPSVVGYEAPLKKGNIYTIAAVGLTNRYDPSQLPCVEVVEIPDWKIWARRFRPIVERKTDISELKALLVPNAKIRERA